MSVLQETHAAQRNKVTGRCVQRMRAKEVKDMAEKTEKNQKSWFDGLKAEFKKIIWPDRKSLVKQTGAVVAVSIVLGMIIAILDFIFQNCVDILVNIHF